MANARNLSRMFSPLLEKISRQNLEKSVRNISTSVGLNMKFLQYKCNGSVAQRLGVQLSQDGDIIEVSAVEPSIPNNLVEFLHGGSELINLAKCVVAEGKSALPLDQVELLAPITKPDKILCVGLNYKTHCDEQKKPYPPEPFFFNKFPSTIVAPNGKITHPPNTRALDWEVELGVVMGQPCRNVLAHQALDFVFGYTCSQDVSARDWQKPTKNAGQWLFAKSMDTFCPLGPSVVMKEYIGDVQNLRLSCSVNGVKKQDGNTNDMVHTVADIVAYLSHCITLLPGDVILTGTPSGVGVFRNPREFLKVGDVIETTISGIGTIRNEVTS